MQEGPDGKDEDAGCSALPSLHLRSSPAPAGAPRWASRFPQGPPEVPHCSLVHSGLPLGVRASGAFCTLPPHTGTAPPLLMREHGSRDPLHPLFLFTVLSTSWCWSLAHPVPYRPGPSTARSPTRACGEKGPQDKVPWAAHKYSLQTPQLAT